MSGLGSDVRASHRLMPAQRWLYGTIALR